MAGREVAERRVSKVGAGGEARRARDRLAVEEPLNSRVAGRPVGVTMRTPGNDVELAIGCCVSERGGPPDDIEAVSSARPRAGAGVQRAHRGAATRGAGPRPVSEPHGRHLLVVRCLRQGVDQGRDRGLRTWPVPAASVASGVLAAVPDRVGRPSECSSRREASTPPPSAGRWRRALRP